MPSERRPSSNSGRPPRAGRPSGSSRRTAAAPARKAVARRPAVRAHEVRAHAGSSVTRFERRSDVVRDDLASGGERRHRGDTTATAGEAARHAAIRPGATLEPHRPRTARPLVATTRRRPSGRGRVAPRRVEQTEDGSTDPVRRSSRRSEAFANHVRQAAPPPWEREQWIDDGPLRSAARKAACASSERKKSSMPPLDRSSQVVGARARGRRGRSQRGRAGGRAAKYQERLATAADALDRGRYDDARRMVQPVLRDLPDLAFGARDRRSGAVPHRSSGARQPPSSRWLASSTARWTITPCLPTATGH